MFSCLILSFCCFRFCKKWCLQIITLYLFASFNTAILCSVHPKWFVKYVYGQIWFVKTWIMKYESGVVKSNPGICICMYVYIYIYIYICSQAWYKTTALGTIQKQWSCGQEAVLQNTFIKELSKHGHSWQAFLLTVIFTCE